MISNHAVTAFPEAIEWDTSLFWGSSYTRIWSFMCKTSSTYAHDSRSTVSRHFKWEIRIFCQGAISKVGRSLPFHVGHGLQFSPKTSVLNKISVLFVMKTIVVVWTFNPIAVYWVGTCLRIGKSKSWRPIEWDTPCNAVTAIFFFSLQTPFLKRWFSKCFSWLFYHLLRL